VHFTAFYEWIHQGAQNPVLAAHHPDLDFYRLVAAFRVLGDARIQAILRSMDEVPTSDAGDDWATPEDIAHLFGRSAAASDPEPEPEPEPASAPKRRAGVYGAPVGPQAVPADALALAARVEAGSPVSQDELLRWPIRTKRTVFSIERHDPDEFIYYAVATANRRRGHRAIALDRTTLARLLQGRVLPLEFEKQPAVDYYIDFEQIARQAAEEQRAKQEEIDQADASAKAWLREQLWERHAQSVVPDDDPALTPYVNALEKASIAAMEEAQDEPVVIPVQRFYSWPWVLIL
jgi:hypothetical protein